MRKGKYPDFRFNLEELAGAVGDYSTLFPIVLGAAIISGLNLGIILLFFGIWYIVTGLYYKMPVPVEPMKAVGVIVIAGGLTAGEIAGAGIILGIIFLGFGFFKSMKFIQRMVPRNVVRGIQLGLALLLLKTAFNFVSADWILGALCVSIILIFLVANSLVNVPDISALIVLALGVGLGILMVGVPPIHLMSVPSFIVPTVHEFLRGGVLLAIPQAPLTITNAILATVLLTQDLLDRDVDPDKLSKSIGLMNLISVPFGGFPMCHGAGGLAAQYRFGARTGGSNIMSGLILLPIALFFASPEWVVLVPLSVFGAMLVFIGIELGRHGLKTDSFFITGLVAILALLINMVVAFIVGMIAAYYISRYSKKSVEPKSRRGW